MGLLTLAGASATRPSCTASYPSVCAVFACTTTHGPALMTVAGTTVPSASNTWVMPTLRPMMPVTINKPAWRRAALLRVVFLPERLDLHVHAGRQVELHQRVDRLRRRLE